MANRRKASVYALIGVGTASAIALGLTPVAPAPPAAADGLARFNSCDELRDWYVSRALSKVTAWGLQGDHWGSGGIALDAAGQLSAAAEDGGFSRSAASGETGTNVQEAGVDEPDIAKSDGEIAAVVDGSTVRLYDVARADAVQLSSIDLGKRDGSMELLLVGERLVVLQQSGSVHGWGSAVDAIDSSLIAPSSVGTTTVSVIDISDAGQPVLESTQEIDSELITAREHQGVVRLVVRHQPTLDFTYPAETHSPQSKALSWQESEQHALEMNRAVLKQSDVSSWIPTVTDTDGNSRPLVECDDVRHPTAGGTAMGSISIVTFDPATLGTGEAPGEAPGEDWDTTSVTASGNLVYASTDRLYVGHSEGSQWWSSGRSNSTTDIHAFDISGEATGYVASGSVEGVVPDRWALSEDSGYLRVAATHYANWRPEETHVTVLDEQGSNLTAVGDVGGIGENEEIQAVRWFGDLSIVVTFRQVDPLYTLDLGDPTSPRVLGELKIPGFSAYLHPLGDDLVLGVGQGGLDNGNLTGSAASTFDLSDLTRPTQLATLPLGERYSSSPVEQDSRAFTYLPEVRVAFVPVWDRSGLRIAAVAVGGDGGLDRLETFSAGRSEAARALTLGADRVAIVADGGIDRIASFMG